MRLALLALALCASTSARAAYIKGELGLACSDLDYQHRITAAAVAGDKQASMKLIDRGLMTGQCAALKNGTRVRIEKNAFPYACVTVFGTGDDCMWVLQRYVSPRE